MIVIYTDGSAKKNGSKDASGGFGVVVCNAKNNGKPEEYNVLDVHQEFTEGTTNNREEMKAIIWSLEHYGDEKHRENGFLIPTVYSDSMYCINSFTNWITGWKANGWVRAGGKKLENLDLIKIYDSLIEKGYKIDLRYIKGHDGEIWNEIADKLATGRISKTAVLNEFQENKYEQLTLEGWN